MYMNLHNEVKALHLDFDFIYTDGSLLSERLLQLKLSTIIRLLNTL